jgi:uncharacterized membrane protein YgaE (UPF0421/DUF939 family)
MGTQLRGISELRESEQTATSSASAKEFIEAMKELHGKVKQRGTHQHLALHLTTWSEARNHRCYALRLTTRSEA